MTASVKILLGMYHVRSTSSEGLLLGLALNLWDGKVGLSSSSFDSSTSSSSEEDPAMLEKKLIGLVASPVRVSATRQSDIKKWTTEALTSIGLNKEGLLE